MGPSLSSTGDSHVTLRREEPPMSCAEIIALDEVRARKQWDTLRQQLHTRFDQWRDVWEARWQKPEPTLADVTATVGALRQQRTSGVTETIIHPTYQGEQR